MRWNLISSRNEKVDHHIIEEKDLYTCALELLIKIWYQIYLRDCLRFIGLNLFGIYPLEWWWRDDRCHFIKSMRGGGD